MKLPSFLNNSIKKIKNIFQTKKIQIKERKEKLKKKVKKKPIEITDMEQLEKELTPIVLEIIKKLNDENIKLKNELQDKKRKEIQDMGFNLPEEREKEEVILIRESRKKKHIIKFEGNFSCIGELKIYNYFKGRYQLIFYDSKEFYGDYEQCYEEFQRTKKLWISFCNQYMEDDGKYKLEGHLFILEDIDNNNIIKEQYTWS